MLSLKFVTVTLLCWQLSVIYSIPIQEDLKIAPLTPEQRERLASWTEDDKQNIWELSGQVEGDMLLTNNQRNGLIDKGYRWPKKELRYVIDKVFTSEQRKLIVDSIKEISNKTCIKLRPRQGKERDYVLIGGDKPGCFSAVGRKRGKQEMNLEPTAIGKGCMRSGTIVHEFVHALGFYHQQSSSDRDNYIEIVRKNIKEGKEHNFVKYPPTIVTSFNETYDYGSIMHYSAYAFSKNGEKTIITKDPNASIGQRNGLSAIDIAKLNKMYSCY